MNKELSIKPAIEELQRVFGLLNERYFNGELQRPVITINTDTQKGTTFGWITTSEVWSDKEGGAYREINLCAEYLHRATELIVSTLLHEMCHLYNMQRGIKDTSRGVIYHNKHFKNTAEARGLLIEKAEKIGYSVTSPTQELITFVRENVRGECFELERVKKRKDSEETTTRQSMRKYICPVCGFIVRVSKDATGKLMCVDCDEVFIES